MPLLLPEARSSIALGLLKDDTGVAIWWGSPLECVSAMCRRHRERAIPSPQRRQASARLDALVEDADVVAPTIAVLRRATRLLAAHPLRAADALQLAAALVWCGDQPAREEFVCLDDRLASAAAREGFVVLPERLA